MKNFKQIEEKGILLGPLRQKLFVLSIDVQFDMIKLLAGQ